MDRNQFIGLILMLVLITAYFQFFAPDPPTPDEIDNAPIPVDTTSFESSRSPQPESTEAQLSDSVINQLNDLKYGLFASKAIGEESIETIESDKLKVTFSTKGGRIIEVEMKDYQKFDGTPLVIVNGNHSINLFFEHLSKRINLNELFFNSTVRNYGDSTSITFDMEVNGARLSQIYMLRNNSHELGYQLRSNGFEKQIDARNLTLYWAADMARLESDIRDARNRTTVRYYTLSGDGDDLSRTSTSHEEEMLNEPIKWASFNQKFFTAAIVANKSFSSGFLTQDPSGDEEEIVKRGSMQLEIPYTDLASNEADFSYYFGPNKYSILKDVSVGFGDNIELGWAFLPWINKYLIIPIWDFLERFIPNYGLLIIILTLVIRLILSPLTYTSHISMAKMRALKPELDEIKERNDGDMQKSQTETMDLYRKAGINPFGGCIPVLLQFPILVSLFYYIPATIDLRMVSFLWAEDLSTYDSILNLPFTIPFYGSHISLFTLLMAGSTILYTMANSQMTTIQGPMKTLQYVMPVMLLFFFNSYPSGLSYYYFISNLVSFGQMALFRRFIDEGKIHKIVEKNKKKNANRKKSAFQTRLEEAMKANQEAAKKKKRK